MVLDWESAARRAEAERTNVPGTCQLRTRNLFEAPSAGDVDHDGDYDAVDGWLKEPLSARHVGDRNPPRGRPVAFLGGSKGYGHRAVSLGDGVISSTDMNGPHYQAGKVSNTTIADIEREMGVKYAGWSETIDGLPIPEPEYEPRTRGSRVDSAIRRLRHAEKLEPDGTRRDTLLKRALKKLEKIPFYPKKLKVK